MPSRLMSTDYVFPVVSGPWASQESKTIDVQAIYGTAFFVTPGFFMTAAHVLDAALQHDGQALARRVDPRHWRMWPILEHEVHRDLDIALLRVSSLTRVAPPAWRFDELFMLDEVEAVGYPYGLDLENRMISTRAFRGYICSPTTWHGLPAKPRVYELSMPSPRGLSGAPLWHSESSPTVVGVVLGNSIAEMTIFSETERTVDGTMETVYEKTEALHLGLALQSSALRDVRFELVGSTLGDFLESKGLVVRGTNG